MNNKIKVIHYAKGVHYSGTHRVSQTICKYLNKDRFDVYLLYRKNDGISRLECMKDILGEDKVIEFEHEHGKNEPPYWPKRDNFIDVVKDINPDIIHAHRAGNLEFPFIPGYLDKELPKVKFVEHHIFDRMDTFPWDMRIFICNYIAHKCMGVRRNLPHRIVYNPVEKPYSHPMQDTHKIVFGRIGRPDNFCDIALQGMRRLVDLQFTNFKYKIIGACDNWKRVAKDLGIEEYCEFLPMIYGNKALSDFYNSIDALAHARSDGEINGTAISEAQIHGVPVVTHKSPCYNGQEEQIGYDRGFCVEWKDYQTYADCLYRLAVNPKERKQIGGNAQKWALENIEASVVVGQIEQIYEGLLE